MIDYICPNCGAVRSGYFCAACGQNRKNYVQSSWKIVGDLIIDAFDLDSRLVKTVRGLLFSPGHLSLEFSRNRRASYVPPARLYLIVSIVFFTTLTLTSDFEPGLVSMDDAIQELPVEDQKRIEDAIESAPESDEAMPGIVIRTGDEAADPWERALREWGREMLQDPGGAYAEFLSKLPIAMFVMLPFYTLWLKLLYWRRFYAEHLVFALHLHAFLFAIGTLILLLPDQMPAQRSSVLEILYGPGVFLNGALKLVGALYYLMALRRMYEQSWAWTGVKFVVANIGHIVFLSLGVAATAVVMFLMR